MSDQWLPTWSIDMIWKVKHTYDGHLFTVLEKTCTCCF